jgi:hypothetical protein
VRYRSPPRIDWAPGDVALATCRLGAVHVHDLRGRTSPQRASRELAADRILDARWQADGRILGIDDRGALEWGADGELAGQRHATEPRPPHAAFIAADGQRFVAIGPGVRASLPSDLYVKDISGERVWTLNGYSHEILGWEGRLSAALSGDGTLVAVGYETPGSRSRSFVVIEIESDDVLDRGKLRGPARGPLLLAFDEAGTRLVQGVADSAEGLSPIRVGLGRTEAYGLGHPGGAVAVAIDRGGQLAAFAYPAPPPGARGRLRVDYLSPEALGMPTVEVLDTLSIEPALPDLVALAFSRDSRSLACLASTGAIEIVPVP